MSRRGERQVPVQMQEDIRKLRSQGWTYPKLADHFELSRITIRNVVRREQAYSDCPRETSEKTRAKIQKLYREEGLTYSALAKRFSLDPRTIRLITLGLTKKELTDRQKEASK